MKNNAVKIFLVLSLLVLKMLAFCPHEHSHCLEHAQCHCDTEIHAILELPSNVSVNEDMYFNDIVFDDYHPLPAPDFSHFFERDSYPQSHSHILQDAYLLRGPPAVS